MRLRDRATLKGCFADGKLPTGEDFGQLIDSMLHMQDEGFNKTPEDGLKVTSAVGQDALLTFYRTESSQLGSWSMSFGGAGDPLAFSPASSTAFGAPAPQGPRDRASLRLARDAAAPVLSLHRDGRVGVGTAAPGQMLEVAGFVASIGRMGVAPEKNESDVLLADGQWHTVADNLHGVVALEVVASVVAENTGHHALLHATALNAHNPMLGGVVGWLARKLPRLGLERRLNRRKRIRSHAAWFGDRCDQLELQWEEAEGEAKGVGGKAYRLRIRTRCAFPVQPPPNIDVHITRLLPPRQSAHGLTDRPDAPASMPARLPAQAPDPPGPPGPQTSTRA